MRPGVAQMPRFLRCPQPAHRIASLQANVRTLLWFRGKDLRLADHLALRSAAEQGELIPLFVLDPFFFAPTRAGTTPYRIQFLLDSLLELQTALEQRGSRLVLAEGKSHELV